MQTPSKETDFFYQLTPDRILSAVESTGVRCTGRTLALNSLENRVYEVEIELPEEEISSRYDSFRVIKFYRPGRWNKEQILDEHNFLIELEAGDIPVVTPVKFPDGTTLKKVPDVDIFYCVYPRVGGRINDEPSEMQLRMLGRLIARLHSIGAARAAENRLDMNPEVFGRENLRLLLAEKILSEKWEKYYTTLVEHLCERMQVYFDGVPLQRTHGDLHCGNILWTEQGLMLVDFDDMVMGPCVQDLWLIVTGRDDYALKRREMLIEGYEEFRTFNRDQVQLIEPLRALRMIRFNTWIAQRREDPSFQRAFPLFGTDQYWQEQITTLQEQLEIMQGLYC